LSDNRHTDRVDQQASFHSCRLGHGSRSVVAGVVIYVLQWLRNRARGIDTSLMYQELPPD